MGRGVEVDSDLYMSLGRGVEVDFDLYMSLGRDVEVDFDLYTRTRGEKAPLAALLQVKKHL